MVVLRNGIEIGWAPIELRDVQVQGTYVYLTPGATLVVTDEPIRGRALVLPATLLEANDSPGTSVLDASD